MPDDENKTELVAERVPRDMANAFQRPMLLQNMPMMDKMEEMGPVPYPILFFFFPRVMLFFMMRSFPSNGNRKLGIQHITQLVRDNSGRIVEVIEFTR